jgi:3-oxoacyl-[acyl-carrier protein] reductase
MERNLILPNDRRRKNGRLGRKTKWEFWLGSRYWLPVGSRGIGASIAKRLAKDRADVAITYSSSPERAQQVVDEIVKEGGKAVAIKADAADQAAVRAGVQQAANEFGKIDILVSNAGVLALGPIAEFPADEFEKALSVNVHSVFTAIQEALRHIPDGGRIITIGSVNSERMPFPGKAVYALTKGAVSSFTKGLARNPASGHFADTMLGLMALKRYGHADEVAGPEAGYITGASLIDGGLAA